MEARQDAQALVRGDPRLQRPAISTIREELARRVGHILSLVDMA